MSRLQTVEEAAEHKAWVEERLAIAERIRRRFEAFFTDSDAIYDARYAREEFLDADLANIPPRHRLIVARQTVIALREHGLYDRDADDQETHLRAIAARLGVPSVELVIAQQMGCSNPDAHRLDLDDWVEWCREHAPERLAGDRKAVA